MKAIITIFFLPGFDRQTNGEFNREETEKAIEKENESIKEIKWKSKKIFESFR